MLSQTVFNINGESLRIKSDDKLEAHEYISSIIESLPFDLNHNLEGSIAYEFNELALNTRLNIPSYFKSFLELNIKMRNGYKEQFDPFIKQDDEIKLVISEDSVEKKEQLVIDTSYLRSSFMIDFLSQEIRSSGVRNFLIIFQNLLYSYGEKEWVFSHDLLSGAYGIKDEAILISEYIPQVNSDSDITPSRLIIKGKDLSTCRVEELIFPELTKEKDLLQYAEENQVNFIIFNDEWKTFTFP
jgi:hypothetical protein